MGRVAMFLLAMLAALPSAMAASVPERFAFSAAVTVAADGSVQVGGIEGFQGRLSEVVHGALGKLDFIPATRGGVPVPSTVLVDGEAVLVPVGDDFEIAIEGLETQPRLLKWRPADYTPEMARERKSGAVALKLQVGADGRVQDSTVTHGSDTDMARAARLAVADWQFQPPVEGHGFEVGAAFWFHGSWDDPAVLALPEIPCNLQPQGAHLAGEDGCLRISESTIAKASRAEVESGKLPVVPLMVRSPAPPSAGGYRYSRD